jgi:hypothetical protein
MSGFQVGVGALSAPAQRLKQVSTDLGTASSGAGSAAASGKSAAGDPRVGSAAEVFEDAGLLADKVQKAGVTYEAVDRKAMPGGGGPH